MIIIIIVIIIVIVIVIVIIIIIITKYIPKFTVEQFSVTTRFQLLSDLRVAPLYVESNVDLNLFSSNKKIHCLF